MSERDAAATRMIAALMRLERAPWPGARLAYAAMLTALAVRCETRPAAVGELYRWLRAELAGTLNPRHPDLRVARCDALAMIVAEIAGLLHRFRASLDRAKRPNLVSMLRFQVWRQARDILAVERRYRARFGAPPGWDPPVEAARAERMTLAGQVVDLLGTDDRAARGLLAVAQGHSVAAAARKTGASRQAIYRRREWLLAEIGQGSDPE